MSRKQRTPDRNNPLRQIDRARRQIIDEISRDFDPGQQAEALGLVVQALLMEVRNRSSTEYACAWLDVMHAFFAATLDDAAQADNTTVGTCATAALTDRAKLLGSITNPANHKYTKPQNARSTNLKTHLPISRHPDRDLAIAAIRSPESLHLGP